MTNITPPPVPAPVPYYRDEQVTLYHADATAWAGWAEGADLLLTDPPYGRAWRQRPLGRGGETKRIAGDEDTRVRDAILAAWGPGRPAIVFGDLMLPPPDGTRLVCTYLRPPNAGVHGAIGGVRRDQDAVYLAGPWPAGIGGRSSCFTTSARSVGGADGLVARAGGHPHTKPQDVLRALLDLAPGAGVVADPCCGGGSVLVAVKAAGLCAVGVEVEERWCEVAARRLAQDVLFGA